jgi:teichuronic acid biosynthesis glycosyltransferase TuaC
VPKVLCLTEMYPNSDNSFLGSFVHSQNRALAEKGIEIKVISPVPWVPFPLSLKKEWGRLNRIPQEEILDTIEVYHPRRPFIPKRFGFHFNGLLYYRFVRQLVVRLSTKFNFDLIHAHVAFPDGFAGALLGREVQRPLIITVHGKDTANARWSTVHLSEHCKKAIFTAFSFSSKIVAVSNYVKRSMLEIYPTLDSEKIVVIHGGVGVGSNNTHDMREQQPDAVTILSVGALVPLKGHRFTIEAMTEIVKTFPNCRLIIVGEGEEKGELIRQVEKSGLRNFVSFLNILPHDQLLSLMATCGIFVLPSWAEGLGMVYIEAMALGLPVIGCKGQGIEDVVNHGRTGFLVEPKNSQELAKVVLKLLKDRELRRKIGEAGREIVLRNYRWKDNAAKHIQLYETLIMKQNTQVE